MFKEKRLRVYEVAIFFKPDLSESIPVGGEILFIPFNNRLHSRTMKLIIPRFPCMAAGTENNN